MTTFNNILLSTACFAPIQYMAKLIQYEHTFIEQHENFTKQTYRNRYIVSGANGPLTLVVPVVKGRGRKIKIRDLQISYDTDWQRNHWRTIFSAYNSSPFFEYYQDDLQPFYNKPWNYLFDFNIAAIYTLCDLLELEVNIHLTPDYELVPENTINFRESITPKSAKAAPDNLFQPESYTQVFTSRFGFIPNLSILDLLFNEGPNSISILQNSIQNPGN